MAAFRPYANLSGRSGVRGYFVSTGAIEVQFKDGSIYLYTYPVTGKAMVDEMISRAHAGQGLNSYITRVVKTAYAEKR